MKYKTTVTDIEISHEDLVTLFSDSLYGDHTFDAWVDEENEPLKSKGEGDCYEDKLANVLLNGGYICITDNEAEEDECNSDVLPIAGVYTGTSMFGEYRAPYYKIDLERIKQAFKEILAQNTTGEYSDGLYKNYIATYVDEDGDFYDAWNILQYIIFGDVVYG